MDDLKERCRKVMLTHLKSKGFPNMSRREIIQEVPAMWNALDVSGLMPEIKATGNNYEMFCDAAVRKAQEAAFDDFVAQQADQLSKRRVK